MNADLEKIWKEAVMVYIVGTEYSHKESEDITSFRKAVRHEHGKNKILVKE